MGPIRMTSALIEHLKSKEDAVVAYTSSVLGFRAAGGHGGLFRRPKRRFIPTRCRSASCCTTPAVRVLEIAPPWVRTELMNSQEAEQAMPLDQFIAETIAVLGTDADEICR